MQELGEAALREMLSAVLRGVPTEEKACYGLDAPSSRLMEELKGLWPGLEIEDDGEWIDISFRPLRLRIFISNEAAPPTGVSYCVEELD